MSETSSAVESVEICFSVACLPVAQPRQRHRITFGKGEAFAQNYTPASSPVNAFKAQLRLAAQQHFTGPPWEGPIMLGIMFIMPRPKSMMHKKKPMPKLWHTSKPDLDNLTKAVKDALTGLIWRDDSQVCWSNPQKLVAGGFEQPCVKVRVCRLYEVPTTPISNWLSERP